MVVIVEEDVCVGVGRGSLWGEVGASGVAIGYAPLSPFYHTCCLNDTQAHCCWLVPVSGVCPPRVPCPPLSMLHMQRVHACSGGGLLVLASVGACVPPPAMLVPPVPPHVVAGDPVDLLPVV